MLTDILILDPLLISAARDLCADSGDHNPEYVRGCAELIIDVTYGLNQDEHKDVLIEFLGSPLHRDTDPMTAPQRAALFATFTDVFGHAENEARYAFTRLILNKPVVSWSSHRDGALTYGEASKVLDALNLLNV